MMSNEFFIKLFSFLSEDDAERFWLEELLAYRENGGNLLVVHSESEWSLLHYAAENLFNDVVLWLLSKGVDVNVKDVNGSTPYLIALDAAIDAAVQEENNIINFDVVSTLIENGADVNISSKDGISRESLLETYGLNAKTQYDACFD